MQVLSNVMKTIETPKGKRSVRETVWGNTNGYIAGRFWLTLGPTYSAGIEDKVAEFLAGEERK